MRITRSTTRSSFAALALLAAAALMNAPAAAQTFPSRPVQIINNYAAGSQLDAILRLLAQEASQPLRQSVIVENRPSATALLGFIPLAKSRGDAHLLTTVSIANIVTVPLIEPQFLVQQGKDYSRCSWLMAAPTC